MISVFTYLFLQSALSAALKSDIGLCNPGTGRSTASGTRVALRTFVRHLTIIGVLLLVLGLGVLVWPVLTYTDTEQVMDIGPVEVTVDQTERVVIPPLVAGLAVAGGVALIVAGGRRRR
jgi:hypothetical protein